MLKMTVLVSVLGLAAAPAMAASGERALTGAAIGAGAGAVVAGPVGAVAGGAIGATVGGPRISRGPVVVRPGYRHRVYWRDRRGRLHWRWSR
jgi:osmotically inducible lipoprotein OsmB